MNGKVSNRQYQEDKIQRQEQKAGKTDVTTEVLHSKVWTFPFVKRDFCGSKSPFSNHMVSQGGAISISVTLSHTLAYTARSRIQASVLHRVTVYSAASTDTHFVYLREMARLS